MHPTTQAERVRKLIMSQIPCEIVSGELMTVGTAGRLLKSYGFAVHAHDGYLWGRWLPEGCTSMPFDPVDPEWSRVAKVVTDGVLYPVGQVSVLAVERWLGF